MITRILCWAGFHPWAYGYNHMGHIDERRCYRCKTRQAPYDAPVEVGGSSNFERAA